MTVWEILHDGGIVGLEGSVPGDVRVTVEIEYIRERLPDPGDRFHILLTQCTFLECRDFVKDQVRLLTDLKVISAIEPEILSAKRRDQMVVISLSRGSGTYMELQVQYEGLTISVENGREVPLEELVNAARKYWDGFGRRR